MDETIYGEKPEVVEERAARAVDSALTPRGRTVDTFSLDTP